MKKYILLSVVIFCISCGETKKENEVSKKTTVRCDSADMTYPNEKTGKDTTVRIWRCDSEYVEPVSK